MKKSWKAWCEFWFAPVGLLNLAIFRIIVCSTMGVLYFDRLLDWKIFYSNDGILPQNLALQVIPEFYRPSFAWFYWPDSLAFIFHAALVVGLLLLATGIGGRVLNFIVWTLHIGFLHRNFSVAFGADLIGGIFLLYLSFTQSCARLSLWHVIRKSQKIVRPDILTNLFYRMIQIQLCIIYAYTGFEKLKGLSWWDGTALWTVMANPQMVVADFSWLRNFPLAVVGFAFATIAFEIYFPALVWNSKTRKAVLISGVLFHSGIGLLMALYNFAFIMMAPYVLFLPEESLSRLTMRRNN